MLRSGFLFAFSVLILITPAAAEPDGQAVFGPYRTQLPQQFVLVPSQTPGVLLLAHREKARFPSLNILEISGPYNFDRSESEILSSIVSSYKQVGLAGVRSVSVSASVRDSSPFPLVSAHLTYEDGEITMHSFVFITSSTDSHYIATLLGPAAQEAELERHHSSMLLSLEHSNPPAEQADSAPEATPVHSNLFWIILVGVGVLTLLGLYGRRRR